MDKESLSTYGWIIVTIIILALMLLFATPFGSWCVDSMQQIPTKLSNAFGFTSVETPGGTGTGGTTIKPTPPGGEGTGTTVHTCNYSVLVSSTPSTCKTAGSAIYKCNTCENTQTQTLAIDPSNHAGETNVTYVSNLTLADTKNEYYYIYEILPLDKISDKVFHKTITRCADCGSEISSKFEEHTDSEPGTCYCGSSINYSTTLEWADETYHADMVEYTYGSEDEPETFIDGYALLHEEAHVDSDIPEYTDDEGVVHYLCSICQLGEDPGPGGDEDIYTIGLTVTKDSISWDDPMQDSYAEADPATYHIYCNGTKIFTASSFGYGYGISRDSITGDEDGTYTIEAYYNGELVGQGSTTYSSGDSGDSGDECEYADIHNTYNYNIAVEISANSYVSRGGTLPDNWEDNPEIWHFFMCPECDELWFLGDI